LFKDIRREISLEPSIIQAEHILPFNSARNPISIFRNILSCRKLESDIYHITGAVNYVALGLPRERTILTIHDLHFLETDLASHPLRKRYLEILWYRLPVSHCARVVAISEWTKQALLRHTKLRAEDVEVIPNCYSPRFTYRKNAERKNVLLVVGTMVNKNVPSIIRASAGLNVTVRIIGRMSDEIRRAAEKYGVAISNADYVPDDLMPEEYHNADALIFPTLREGFGIPILEAQATGTPVLTSNIEPVKTVAGGGAYLVDPNDVDSIRKGILTLLNDNVLRKELIEKGLDNSKQYTVSSVAEQYKRLYEIVLSK